MKALAFLLAIIVGIFACLVGFQNQRPRADFVFATRGDVFTLDPQRMSWLNDMQIAYCLFEGLVRWNPTDFSIELACADRFVVSDDNETYTFHIREDATWSNGAVVTSHDFKFAWMRLLTPDTASDYSNFLFSIKGAKCFWDWRNRSLKQGQFVSQKEIEKMFGEMVGIRTLDHHTIEVKLEFPVPYFLDQLALAVCSPVYRPAVEGWILDEDEFSSLFEDGWYTKEVPPFSKRRWVSQSPETGRIKQQYFWARPDTMVCNGPFVLDTWRYKRDMWLTRNPFFHSPTMTSLDSIQAITMADANTAVLAFEAGEVDWLSGVNVDYQADMLRQKERGTRTNIHAFPTFGTDFFSFNCRNTLQSGTPNPFHDAAVRGAFVNATNRDSLVTHATRLREPIVTSFVPPHSIQGYETVQGLQFDPDAAREKFKKAGWEDRDGDGIVENSDGLPFPVIDLLYTTNTPRYKWMALELRNQWKKQLGVEVNLRGTDNKFFSSDLRSGNFMIARGRWYGDYGDPTTFLDIFRSDSGNNDRGYVNSAIDEALDAASLEQDPLKRMQMLHDVERILFQEEVPMLVICQLLQLYMYEPEKVQGLVTHPRLVQQLWRVTVSPEDQ